jgi:phosphonate transport system substrate-binding protein
VNRIRRISTTEQNMSRRFFVLRIFALLVFLPFQASAVSQTFTISVVPQFTPVDIGLRWMPLLQRLEAETGYRFQLRLFEKIPKFETDFLSGAPDLVYLNPYHMIMAAKAHGYAPLVRGAEPLVGILVADRNGPIQKLEDLNDRKLAFPAPNAFGASLYLRALLHEKAGLRFDSVYVGSHQNVYRHVLIGDAAAGGGINATLEKEPASLQARLRVLFTTPGVAPHPLAAHPRVPQAAQNRIRAALLKFEQDPADRKLLAAVELDKAVSADFTRDYLPLERLKLEQYVINN